MNLEVKESVCAIILTYKDRINFVKQVSEALYEQGVLHIILVSNGTPKNKLNELNYGERLTIIDLEQNCGSGKGYRAGLEAAINTSCEFFWLLDDDNLPEETCLTTLRKNWGEQTLNTQPDKLALSCYRDDQFDNRELNVSGNKIHVQPRQNSYHGFHVSRLLDLINDRIIKKPSENITDLSYKEPVYEIDGAFFGGLYMHRSLIQKISFPTDHYFVYVDDLEYSLRITEAGGKILMIRDAKIHGLDWSIPLKCRTSKLYHSTLDYVQPFRTYYCARNIEDYTRRKFVTNKALYYLNLSIFVMTIGTMAILRGRFKHYKLLVSGIVDSWLGRFGENTSLTKKAGKEKIQ